MSGIYCDVNPLQHLSWSLSREERFGKEPVNGITFHARFIQGTACPENGVIRDGNLTFDAQFPNKV